MILDKIVAQKRRDVAERKTHVPLTRLIHALRDRQPPLALLPALTRPQTNIIAEVKMASPSAGVLMKKHCPGDLAQLYAHNGAAAISVVTDHAFFQGNFALLTGIRQKVDLPVLCKDFVIDEYQLYEARAAGADAVLLIAALHNAKVLRQYLAQTAELGMTALVEVHDERDLERALESGAGLIGINNRDLQTFKVSLKTSLKLKAMIPPGKVVVSESGIQTVGDIATLQAAGVQAFLVGETLITSDDPGATLRGLLAKE
jgi:indole-3-glycerol phosphate synthase